MFKTLRQKYIVTFLTAVILSFVVLWLVMASVVNMYGRDVKQTVIEEKASSISVYLNNLLRTNPDMTLEEMVSLHGYELMESVTDDPNELSVVIANRDGAILAAQGVDAHCEIGDVLPDSIMNLVRTGVYIGTGIVDDDSQDIIDAKKLFRGSLGSPELVECYPIVTVTETDARQVSGAVIVFSRSAGWGRLMVIMSSATLISMVIVLIASIVAVSIISARVTLPLKRMKHAVRAYSKGDFSIRIPVQGKDEIAELSIAFNRMAEELGRLETMRNSFLANVSHDLRTPMTTIGGFVDGILDGVIPPEKEKHYLGIVSTEIKRLSRLVSTLLDISKMEAGERKFVPAPFDVCEMGRQILISLEQKIDARGLQVSFACDREKITVEADRDAMYQVLYNLCDNAVKYARDGGRFEIRITEEKNHKVFVTVFNEGQGIPDEDQPYVFDRFFKADKSRGQDRSGLGLGLYIVKTIVKAHGEDIWVKSEYGKNCEFGFSLTRSGLIRFRSESKEGDESIGS